MFVRVRITACFSFMMRRKLQFDFGSDETGNLVLVSDNILKDLQIQMIYIPIMIYTKGRNGRIISDSFIVLRD